MNASFSNRTYIMYSVLGRTPYSRSRPHDNSPSRHPVGALLAVLLSDVAAAKCPYLIYATTEGEEVGSLIRLQFIRS